MFKKIAATVLSCMLIFSCASCTMKKPNDGNDENNVGTMKEIEYEQTKNAQKTGSNVNLVIPPASAAKTGAELTAYVMPDIDLENYNYYIVDWGDGTWSYNGPYVYNDDHKVMGEVYHTYKKAGSYKLKACAVNLGVGKLYGWTEEQTLTVTGDDYAGNMITGVSAISSANSDNAHSAAKIADGDNSTRWQSAVSDSVSSQDYVGYLFDGYYTLDTLEIKFPSDVQIFPSNISVEYTTDGGENWYMLPHYYYVLPNSEGLYSCIMNFPNPKGATLDLPLNQITANGIRIKSLLYPLSSSGVKYFAVEEMRVYGNKGTLLYTSYDGYYNADLSNMWAIFGIAKTEPRMYNSLRGASTNVEPFRSGQTMTASIEWTEWNGAQLNWSGYDEAVNIHVNSLKNAVYGGDGWYKDSSGKYVVDTSEYNNNSRDDGFIWATESAPQHLGEQNHYTNNPALIIASRDYLLTGNGTAGFLDSVNSRGQKMLDKLRKAMEYMLINLNGESGLMTIYDPRNDGTVRGVSSNYWDSLNFFGYNSAYENVLFYRSVLAMADIENYLGNTSDAEYYAELAPKIKRVFNETFWDDEAGRYITAINVKGDVLDFGVTFVNFMAASAGLASEEQAKLVYDWVDGKRIVEGDTSTGEDIYNFKVSARSNTVAVETIVEDGLHYWWYNGHSFNDVLPGHWGEYGNQMQNGGTIFYISHYDVSGRTVVSADNAIGRFNAIMDEFHKDQLRRDPRTKFGIYQVSINGEFPESGLVPLTFVTDIVGITPALKGLKIESNLPSDMSYAGVREYRYGNRVYSVEVNKNLSKPEIKKDGEKWSVKLPAGKTWYITLENKLIEE
ncbi:MAG: hypothetical protein HFE35_05265 [Clostridia bacterium]|nr:hypothetical protein [Clostridia bacterium]